MIFSIVGVFAPVVMFSGETQVQTVIKGAAGYGFAPLQLPPDLDFPSLFHGVDERVPVAGLEFGVRVMERFLRTC